MEKHCNQPDDCYNCNSAIYYEFEGIYCAEGIDAGVKQVIVIRKDLGMSAGKMVSQGAHASGVAERFMEQKDFNLWHLWHQRGFKKVTCKVNTEEDLLNLIQQAKEAGIICVYITDFTLQAKTAIALGPDIDEVLDPITRQLKLL